MSEPDPTREFDDAPGPQGETTYSQFASTDPALDPLQALRNPDNVPTATHVPSDSSSSRETSIEDFPGYKLLEILGEGGMGKVYKARQDGLNRLVALKVILGGRRAGPKELIRFLAEAEAVASIKHPHVVQVHEYGEVDGRPFLTLEYLPGGTLAERLKNEIRLEPQTAAKLVAKLARAVQEAHDHGIVHRDLKPTNILFDTQGEPKVIDFGLAKKAKGTDLTQTQAVMGTPAYMSPEQAQGNSKFVGPQSDIYSLGVILYECMTGSRPFHNEDTHVLLRMVIEDEPIKPRKYVPGMPRDLELITLMCLAKDPAERYPTAQALAVDLAHFSAGEPVSVRPPGTIERTLKWAKRKPTQAAAYALTFAVVVLMAFGTSLAVLWRKAELATEKMTAFEYGRTIQVAHQEWRENNVAASLALLKGTDPKLRGWEWRYVHSLCNGELLTLRGHRRAAVFSVPWSPDGSRIATASADDTARVWDARSGYEILTLKGHTESVNSVSWSPDGSRIATASNDKMARVWDARSGYEILILKGHTSDVTCVSWSPDGSRIATISRDGTARVWDAPSGAETLTLKGHTKNANSVSWSPDGSRIATADGKARVWDASTGAEILTFKGHTFYVSSVSWSPDGTRIASTDGTARVWDARSGDEVLTLKGGTSNFSSVSWSRDGSRIATISSDRTAQVWDARSGAELLTLKGHGFYMNSVSWSPDGSRIATGSWDSTARVWDARSEDEALTLKEHSNTSVSSVSWSPNGSRIATASADDTARVWDARSGAEVLTLKGHTESLNSVSWSPDGSRIATASKDKTTRVWDARSGDDILTLLNGHTESVTSLSWSPDGSRIATTSWDETARVWDASTGAEILKLKGHTIMLNSVSWSPDGARIAAASNDRTARVWDASSGAELLTLKGHTEPVNSVSWNRDGSRIATASDDETARVWDARSGAELLTLKGHTNYVYSVSWSPDGSRIATASWDGTARIWDSRSRAERLAAGQ